MDESAFQRGISDAQSDIAASACRMFWQTRGKWGELFTKLMEERFSVQVVHVSDLTDETKVSYESGYNSTIETYVDKTFGTGSFKHAWNEIQEYRQESYRQWLASKDDS